jgi:uncharacterized protein (TIGR02757 family)
VFTANLKLKALFESAYRDFHSGHYREKDPISLVHRYSKPQDQEVAAFLTALISYGNVATILTNAGDILSRLGDRPHRRLVDTDISGLFSGFRHRFTAGIDVEILCTQLSILLRTHGSLEAFFSQDDAHLSPNLKSALSSFVRRFAAIPLPAALRTVAKNRQRSQKYLLSDPERGSACKRLNMFLRWMVRPEDGVDLGLWKKIKPGQLMLPVDTHLLQTLQILKWTKSNAATWKVSEEATLRLRHYDVNDPIRYDFALCHLSMTGKSIRMYF